MSDAQKLTELLGRCWHERDWSKEPTMWVGGKGIHCFTCVKCKQPIPVYYDYNRPTYTHADEVLRAMRRKLEIEGYKLFMAKLQYGFEQPNVEAVDWDGSIDEEYILNVPALVQKAIEFLEQMKGE